jgi:site-specific DNA recombinase
MRSDPRNNSKPSRKCAIYTRVSTDSGLEQDFNSLDNQREASEAYIKSQAHEGWKLVRDRFDDGGFSGGSMERPALQKLLDEIRARRIDVIVVYKVDRLTRSLADFAKLVDLFDAHEVSFISVTQSFNTTTSMGRLTLNMLLSFAQFEREITGERIRDKVAASKRKGIWMGGAIPLGYRVENRALHIVEEEAEFIRGLFRRYLELGSVVRLKAALDAAAAVTPARVSRSGRTSGGRPFSRGHLYWILSNPIYIGRLSHKGQVHEGLHAAIVEREVWETIQERLQAQTVSRRDPQPDLHSFLAGKLYDDCAHRMSASYACKGSKRFRYYVSRPALVGNAKLAGSLPRISAPEIEREVVNAVERHLASRTRSSDDRERELRVSQLSRTQSISSPPSRGQPIVEIQAVIERVTVHASRIEIVLNEACLDEGELRTLTLPFAPTPTRRKRQIILRAETSGERSRAMRVNARAHFKVAIFDARRWLDELVADPCQTIETIAAREHRSPRSLRMTLSLAFLSPELVKAALEGRLPRGLNARRMTEMPMLWSDQWRALGIQSPAAADA